MTTDRGKTVRRLRTWAVTNRGLESLTCPGGYVIEKARLLDSRGQANTQWLDHLRGKNWVDMGDFAMAFHFAMDHHHPGVSYLWGKGAA